MKTCGGFLKINKYSMLAVLISSFMVGKTYAAGLPEIRDLNVDPISIQDVYNHPQPDSNLKASSEAPIRLRGGVTEINCAINRAQLIKFDEPVKRVSLANPEIADVVVVTPRQIEINAKKMGTTSLIVWGEKGDPVFFDIVIGNNITGFLNAIKTSFPGENMPFKFSDNSVVLTGIIKSTITKDKVKSIAEAYGFKFVDITESSTPQVMLEIKVVEASKSYTKTIKNLVSYNVSDFINKNFSNITANGTNVLGSQFDPTNGIQFYGVQNRWQYGFNDAETKGLLKILAEPKLVATNGTKASFKAGQEVPVPSNVDPTTHLITYTFKQIGVTMEFTPTIYPDSKRISLHVAPEVNEIDPTVAMVINGVSISGFKNRKTDTTVELQNGETLVIAGLLQKNDQNTRSQIPFIGNIPILGDIFRSQSLENHETELIIFVTPKIIEANNLANGV